MGVIQNSINSIIGTTAVAAGLGKKLSKGAADVNAASVGADLKQQQEILDTEMKDFDAEVAIRGNEQELKQIGETAITPEELAAKNDLIKKTSMLRRQREIYKAHIESLKKGGKK